MDQGVASLPSKSLGQLVVKHLSEITFYWLDQHNVVDSGVVELTLFQLTLWQNSHCCFIVSECKCECQRQMSVQEVVRGGIWFTPLEYGCVPKGNNK